MDSSLFSLLNGDTLTVVIDVGAFSTSFGFAGDPAPTTTLTCLKTLNGECVCLLFVAFLRVQSVRLTPIVHLLPCTAESPIRSRLVSHRKARRSTVFVSPADYRWVRQAQFCIFCTSQSLMLCAMLAISCAIPRKFEWPYVKISTQHALGAKLWRPRCLHAFK